MVARAQTVKATSRKVAAKTPFTMQNLWRLALWGSAAAAALLVATLTTRSDIGSQRAAIVLSSLHWGSRPGQAAAQQFDANPQPGSSRKPCAGLPTTATG